jgi:hypothetical protein
MRISMRLRCFWMCAISSAVSAAPRLAQPLGDLAVADAAKVKKLLLVRHVLGGAEQRPGRPLLQRDDRCVRRAGGVSRLVCLYAPSLDRRPSCGHEPH